MEAGDDHSADITFKRVAEIRVGITRFHREFEARVNLKDGKNLLYDFDKNEDCVGKLKGGPLKIFAQEVEPST